MVDGWWFRNLGDDYVGCIKPDLNLTILTTHLNWEPPRMFEPIIDQQPEVEFFTKLFRYLKWRNPHLYKLYGYGLCKGSFPTPKIAIIKVQATSTLGTWNSWWILIGSKFFLSNLTHAPLSRNPGRVQFHPIPMESSTFSSIFYEKLPGFYGEEKNWIHPKVSLKKQKTAKGHTPKRKQSHLKGWQAPKTSTKKHQNLKKNQRKENIQTSEKKHPCNLFVWFSHAFWI